MEYGMSLEILVQDRWDLWGIRLGIRFLGISVSKCDTNSISQRGVVQKKKIENFVFGMTDMYGIKPPTCSRENL